jgi:hypothetical protein
MKRNIYIMIMMVALLSSCGSRYIDFDDMDNTSKLVLYCMPAAGIDTTVVQISRSIPVSTSSATIKSELLGVNVRYMVNDIEQEVLYAEKYLGDNVPAGCYYVVGKLHEGDRVSVEASATGFGSVRGSTTIPKSFPFKEISLSKRRNNMYGDALQFAVSMNGESDINYYAVHFVSDYVTEHSYHNWDGSPLYEKKDYLTHLDMDISEEPLLNNATGMDEIFDVSNDYFRYMYIFTNRSFRNTGYTLHANSYYRDVDNSKHDPDDFGYTHSLYYRVYMYSLSPEMYLYLKSMNDIENNDLGTSGLASIRSHYSNVTGGLGVVCGCNVTATEWIDNPYEPDEEEDDDGIYTENY